MHPVRNELRELVSVLMLSLSTNFWLEFSPYFVRKKHLNFELQLVDGSRDYISCIQTLVKRATDLEIDRVQDGSNLWLQ